MREREKRCQIQDTVLTRNGIRNGGWVGIFSHHNGKSAIQVEIDMTVQEPWARVVCLGETPYQDCLPPSTSNFEIIPQNGW